MLAAIVTLVGAAYPLGLCAFRHGIKEIGFSKHESAWPYVISSAALAISALVFGSSVTTAMAGLVLSALSYRVQILGPRFTAASMEGKVCIVTGSSSGIGLEIAQYLIGLDAHVILACRSEEKALQAREEILGAHPGTKGRASFMKLDLASFQSVRDFAAAFKARKLPLHVLVNNAGVMQHERKLTQNGNEMTLQANFLGHHLLTELLLDTLKATPGGARVVNVSSSMHWGESGFDFDDIQGSKQYTMFGAYEQSKLAQLLLTMELDRRLAGGSVTVNAVHPGSVITDVTRGFHPLIRSAEAATKPVQYLMRKPRWAGAWTAVYCAASPDVAGMSGKYFWNCREELHSELVGNRAVQDKLKDVADRLVGL